MAIIISDFEPSGEQVEIQLPGSKKRYRIPTSDSIRLGDIRKIQQGDMTPLYDQFPTEAHPQLDDLRGPQLAELVEAWTGGEAKN